MDSKKKSISERHKRNVWDFSLLHIRIVCGIAAIAIFSLIVSLVLEHWDSPFWSAIFSNIFAGLLTGLVICIISGTKQVALAKLDAEAGFLDVLDAKIRDFQNLYNELQRKPFTIFDGSVELFDFIYDVGAHANWVNDYILQASFDDRLALEPVAYCKKIGYNALELSKVYEDLHNNLYGVDVNYPTKKRILSYFEVVEKALRGLRDSIELRKKQIDAQLENMKYSLF